jgi:hypothetical protein
MTHGGENRNGAAARLIEVKLNGVQELRSKATTRALLKGNNEALSRVWCCFSRRLDV